MSYDLSLFEGTAPWYRRFRAPYAPAALEHVRAAFGLNAGHRVLDLGCGPGILSVPFSRWAGEVVAMDPDPGMLAEGRAYAAEEGRSNIRWIQGGSLELSPELGRFHLVLMGQSFHWMDRDAVLKTLETMLEPQGGIALINPGRRRPQELWEEVTDPILRAHLGPTKPHPQRNPEGPHEPAIHRSAFDIAERVEFPGEVERDAASVVGLYWSTSGGRQGVLGERAAAFEADVRAALAERFPERWTEPVETEALILRMRGG